MFEPAAYLTFVLACVAVVIVPGPTVTVIIANSLRHGAGAGLANVAGTQAGLAVMLAVLAAGLQVIVEALGVVFEVVKLIGAAYLVYLGAKLLLKRPSSELAGSEAARAVQRRSFFWQGFLVIWANPKALLFFGAFIPQFVSPEGPVVAQTLLLGLTFMAVATLLDAGYALLAGRAGGFLTRQRVRLLEVFSGCFLVGGGVWLALTRR